MGERKRDLVERILPVFNPNEADRKAAWDELLSECCSRILRYIAVINDTSIPHEDILQDAILTSYVNFESGKIRKPFEYDSQIPAYIRTTASYKVLEAFRYSKGSEHLVSIDDCDVASSSNQRHIESVVADRETLQEVWDTLKTMSDKQFRVLSLYLVDGLSAAEIADEMGLTVGHVRVIKHRAMKALEVLVAMD